MSTASESTSNSTVSLLVGSSIGKKFLMAVTGLISFGFVFGHMAGNLQMFLGQNAINAYAQSLHDLGPLLWLARLILIVAFIVHVWLSIVLKAENVAARPIGYVRQDTVKASLASRVMIHTGIVVLAFLIYHLLHFTFLVVHPDYQTMTDSLGRPDVYSRVILGFSSYFLSGFYIIAVGLLCYHLSHGIASMFQSLGLNKPSVQPKLRRVAMLFSLLIFLGFISIPIGVLAGWLQFPPGAGH